MGRRADHVDQEMLRVLGNLDAEEDPRKSYAELHERIRQYRRTGTPVPEPLAIAERQLVTEMMAESQGR